MMTNVELIPCPVFGPSEIDPRSGGTPCCDNCGASPGNSDWNTRAALAPEITGDASKLDNITNCDQCGRIIDKREKCNGGDDHGAQLSDGSWVCSSACWDKAPGEQPVEDHLLQEVIDFVETVAEHRFEEVRNFSGPHPADELEATTEVGPVLAFQDDARDILRQIRAGKTSGSATPHPDDQAVERFANAMKVKLAEAREKGRSGWDDKDDCSAMFLACALLHHTHKFNEGTFEDIANFAMMLHQRGVDPTLLEKAHEEIAGDYAPPPTTASTTTPQPDAVQELIGKIADAAEAFGVNSGTGGMEAAGLIISVLSANPDLTEPFLENPIGMMLLDEFRWQNGRLSWHSGTTGEVITPEFCREHLIIKSLIGDAIDKSQRALTEGEG